MIFRVSIGPQPLILEPKSTIPPSYILLLDQRIDHIDSEMIFQDWSHNRDAFNIRVLHDPIHLGICNTVNKNEVVKGGFLDNPRNLDWAEMIGPILPREPPP